MMPAAATAAHRTGCTAAGRCRRAVRHSLRPGGRPRPLPSCTAGESGPAPAMLPCMPGPPAPCPMPCAPSGLTAGGSPKLTVRCGFDDDLAAQITRVHNRIRVPPRRSAPQPARMPDPRLEHAAAAERLSAIPHPSGLPPAAGAAALRAQAPGPVPAPAPGLGPHASPLLARVAAAGTEAAAPAAAHRCAQPPACAERAGIGSETQQCPAARPRCPVLTGQTCVGPPPGSRAHPRRASLPRPGAPLHRHNLPSGCF